MLNLGKEGGLSKSISTLHNRKAKPAHYSSGGKTNMHKRIFPLLGLVVGQRHVLFAMSENGMSINIPGKKTSRRG